MLNISLTSYLDACGVMATAKNPDKGKPLATSTRLHKMGDNYAVKYHDTYIVVYRPNGEIRLDTGGWLTMMTRQRMDEYLPRGYHLGSLKGRWFLHTPMGRFAFRDGITIDRDKGIVTGYEPDAVVAVQDAENVVLSKAVKNYVAAITPEVVQTALDNAGGDCFGCLAPSAFDVSHLALHLSEAYVPAHLLANALSDKGYQPGVYLGMAAQGTDWALAAVRKHVGAYLRNALYSGAVAVAHGRKPVGAVKVSWQSGAYAS